MAKQETPAAEKATKTQRVHFDGAGGVTFTFPGGAKHTRKTKDFPDATNIACFEYGIRRMFQDRLAGLIKDGEDADAAAESLLARFDSGDWNGRRTGTGGRPTMESIARGLAERALTKKLGRKPNKDELKSGTVQLLDEAHPAHVKVVSAHADAVAAWEATQAVEVEIDL